MDRCLQNLKRYNFHLKTNANSIAVIRVIITLQANAPIVPIIILKTLLFSAAIPTKECFTIGSFSVFVFRADLITKYSIIGSVIIKDTNAVIATAIDISSAKDSADKQFFRSDYVGLCNIHSVVSREIRGCFPLG